METLQARTLVEKTFKHSFERTRFLQFAQELLNHLDTSKQKRWSGNVSSKEAFKDKVNHYERLGSYRDPHGEVIDVLVVHLKKGTTLERGRTSLRNFAADYLMQRSKAAVLVAFVSPDESDWRFSFVKLEYSLEQTESGAVNTKKELLRRGATRSLSANMSIATRRRSNSCRCWKMTVPTLCSPTSRRLSTSSA